MRTTFLLFITFFVCVLGRQGFGPTQQEWGYVDVRPGAHLFWWLHQTSADVETYTDRPLVIWLQGGPGSSGTGYGNFAELGPLDVDLNPRNTTWINDVNVLFVDNPVGTGFSYVDSTDLLVTSSKQQAQDFLVLMQELYQQLPELKPVPLYIFCESYGGKYTVEIAAVLDEAIKNRSLDANFVGVALGDSLLSPVDTAESYASYLLSVGAIDKKGYAIVQDDAEKVRQAVESEDWILASELMNAQLETITIMTDGMDLYNILEKIEVGVKTPVRGFRPRSMGDDDDQKIEVIMDTQVKDALGLNVTWQAQSGYVYAALSNDISVPVTETIELLLNTTTLKVVVYNGQLDMICNTLGQLEWVEALKSDGAADWKKALRSPIVTGGFVEGYYKKFENFAFYWVDRAGHMVPKDNPAAMRYILEDVTDGFGS